jgi:hypothetical protein
VGGGAELAGEDMIDRLLENEPGERVFGWLGRPARLPAPMRNRLIDRLAGCLAGEDEALEKSRRGVARRPESRRVGRSAMPGVAEGNLRRAPGLARELLGMLEENAQTEFIVGILSAVREAPVECLAEARFLAEVHSRIDPGERFELAMLADDDAARR